MKDLDQLSPDELGRLFPIRLSPYKPEWGHLFQEEKKLLENILGADHIIKLEHIGSTAVPGLVSKPTIDILLEIKDGTDLEMIISRLVSLDYHYIHRPDNPAPHMMFVRGYTKKGIRGQSIHVHVRYPGDWDEYGFRDFLIRRITEEGLK